MMQISIIIPVYNSAKLLILTLDAILNSKKLDFLYEILIIDDGSSDNLADILFKKYNDRFENGEIKYWYQENSGVSVARNNGLAYANGEYITFCDADDLVNTSYLDTLYRLSVDSRKPDVVEFRYTTFNSKTGSVINSGRVNKYLGTMTAEHGLNGALSSFVWLVMCRMIKSELAKSVKFPTGVKYCEDLIYLYSIYERAKSINSTDDNLYRYRMGHLSAISRFTLDDCNPVFEFLKQKTKKNSEIKDIILVNLFYIRLSAAKRELSFFEFLKFITHEKLGKMNVLKVYNKSVFPRRKLLICLFPVVYFILYKMKKNENNI
jgi:glycosyltransferase involved in cell wall biosynthesis